MNFNFRSGGGGGFGPSFTGGSNANKPLQQSFPSHKGQPNIEHRDTVDHSHNVGFQDKNPASSSGGSGGSLPNWSYPGNEVGPDHPMFTGGSDHPLPPMKPHHLDDSGSQPQPPQAHFDPYGPPGTGTGRKIDPNPDQLRKPFFRDPNERPNPQFE